MDTNINDISMNGFEHSDGPVMDIYEDDNEMEESCLVDLTAVEDNCCTYTKSSKRAKLTLPEPQALYLCLTCCPDVRKILENCARVCSACTYHCHDNHELVEWYTKRNLLCDCPTERISNGKCTLNPDDGKKTPRTSKILSSTLKRPHPDHCQESFSESRLDLSDIFQTKQYTSNFPHQLIEFMYRLDLSVLCSIKKLKYERKYPSLSLEFQNTEFDKFNNIILRYEEKSIHLQIEHVDKYKDRYVSYALLFAKEKRSFSINTYFDTFVKHLISSSNNIEYLIIYTNSSLDLTEDNKLKQGRLKIFYPFQFERVLEECAILKDFFSTNGSVEGRGFYKFSSNKTEREELLKRLEFSSAMQKDLGDQLSQNEIKNKFLDKLVFAVNQLSREELHSTIQNEIKTNGKEKGNYASLQKEVLRHLSAPPEMLYELNLLTLFLHDMFLYKKIVSINSERKNQDTSNDITINYKNHVIYVKVLSCKTNIGHTQLFSIRKERNYLNKPFATFIEKLKDDMKYFIIYTDADLSLTKENTLKRVQSKGFYPFTFDSVNIQEKKYNFFRNSSFINQNGLYQFQQEKSTRKKLLNLLKLPPSLQKEKDEGKLSNESEKEIKTKFIDKLIFAVKQPNVKEFKSIFKKDIKTNRVPYSWEELHEAALRWSESHELGPISREIIEKLLDDIQNNRFSYQKNQQYIFEEIRFTKTVAVKEGTIAYDQLLDLLVKDERLKILKGKGINPANVSSVLSGAGVSAIQAFNDLYDLWFDEEGNKTEYLTNLEEKGINLASVSSILHGSKRNAAEAFKSLYELWFDSEGKKRHYLTRLEEEGIHLANVSSILSGSGVDAAKAFKDLYNLWFDERGNKTEYLTRLEEEGIHLANVSTILSGSGADAVKAFKGLYNLWFDERGNKTQYIQNLEKVGINLGNVLSILSGARGNGAKAFKDLYDLLFNENGHKTQLVKALQKEGIDLCIVSSIFSGTKGNAVKACKDLFNLWFDGEGNKTRYLKTLETEGLHLTSLSSILSGSGASAAKTFKDLLDLWFDGEGNKSQNLETMEGKGINLSSVSNILHGAGSNAPKAFKDLYELWFDEEGHETQYLRTLEEKGINLINISNTLSGVGANAAKAFKELYNIFLEGKGNKIQYLKALGENGVNLTNICRILSGAGAKALKALQDLYDLWFDKDGNKTQYLNALESEGIDLPNMCNILCGAGAKAPIAFKDLYNNCFDGAGNKTQFLNTLEENKINLLNVSNILHGSGAHLLKAFTELYSTFLDDKGNRNQHLEHFIAKKDGVKSFKLTNLFDILSKAGIQTKDTFEKLHNVCFDEKGDRTQLLDDFYGAGFKPSNLSMLLSGTRFRAAFILKRFHSVCFSEKRKQTKVLNHFLKAGFTISNLCTLLSGTANSIENLHDFCFVAETKNYLKHFLNDADGFTPSDLSKILRTSGADICFALKDFHDVCFDEAGNTTKILDDFYSAGFRPRDLSNLLSMTASRVAFILRNFHTMCFGKENYLNHFLAEQEIFTPKKLSKLLCGLGNDICPIFENLHNLCFDKAGKKRKYLKKLIKNNPPNEIINILHREVRQTACTVSDDVSFQEQNVKKELMQS